MPIAPRRIEIKYGLSMCRVEASSQSKRLLSSIRRHFAPPTPVCAAAERRLALKPFVIMSTNRSQLKYLNWLHVRLRVVRRIGSPCARIMAAWRRVFAPIIGARNASSRSSKLARIARKSAAKPAHIAATASSLRGARETRRNAASSAAQQA